MSSTKQSLQNTIFSSIQFFANRLPVFFEVIFGILISLSLVFYLRQVGGNKYLLLLPLITSLFFAFLATKNYSFFFILPALFLDRFFIFYTLAGFIVLFAFFNHLFHFKNIFLPKLLLIKVFLPVTVYFLLIIPSILFSTYKAFSISQSGNLIILLFTIYLTSQLIQNYHRTEQILLVFFSLTLLNSIYAIFQSFFTSERVFGFAGVMSIDYSGLCIIISGIYFFFTKGIVRILWLIGSIIVFFGLMATQTRNPLLILALVGVTLFFLFLIYSKTLQLKKLEILTITLKFSLVVASLVLFLFLSDSGITKRMTESPESQAKTFTSIDDLGTSSIITRILLWDTAINAFKAKPITGIGIYTFSRLSQQFCTFNKKLYKKYVMGLSPHLGYLMILCETGIIGLIGFLFFIFSILFLSLKNLSLCRTAKDRQIALTITSLFLYVTFSIGVTDLWLLGHGIVFLGLITGFIGSQHLLLLKTNQS
jgi:O-antigen ligase